MANWEKVVLGKGTSSQYIKGDGTFATYGGVGLVDNNTWTGVNKFSTHTGIGVSPETDWKTNVIGLQIGAGGSIFARSDSGETKIFIAENVKWNSTGYQRINSGYSAMHYMDGGAHNFAVAGTDNADTTISFTNALVLSNTGNATFAGQYLNIDAGGTNMAITTNSDTMHFIADSNANGGTHNPFEWWHDSPTIDGGTKIMHLTTSGDLSIANDLTVTGSITTGGVTSTGHIVLPDASGSGGVLKLGASEDIQIYHDGGNSYLDHLNTGDLKIRSLKHGGDIVFHTESSIDGTQHSILTLASDSSSTFAGNITADSGGTTSLTIDGNNSSGDDGRLYLKGHTSSASRAYVYFNNGVSSGGQAWYAGALRGSNSFAIGRGDDYGTNTDFYINSSGNAVFSGDVTVNSGLYPDANEGAELGNASLRFSTVFAEVVNTGNASSTGLAKADMMLQIGGDGSNGKYNAIGFGYDGQTEVPAIIAYKGTSGAGSTKGELGFYTRSVTTNTAPTQRMTISDSGNVGIGNSGGSHRLFVYENKDDAYAVRIKNDHAGGYGLQINAGSSANEQALNITTEANAHIMSVLGDGNVGIGTVIPASKIHIVDGAGTLPTLIGTDYLVIQNNDNTGDQARMAIIAGTTGYSVIDFGDASDVDAGGIAYQHHASSDLMTFRVNATDFVHIKDSGMGIGQDVPTHMLDIYAGTKNASGGVHLTNDDSGGGGADGTTLFIEQNTTDFFIRNYEDAGIRMKTHDTDAMYIDNDQNVGIGTLSPTAPLHVAKAVDSDWIAKFANTGTTNAYGLSIDTTANTGTGEFALGVYTGTGTGMFVTSDGKVGIGTPTPSHALSVNGEVRFTLGGSSQVTFSTVGGDSAMYMTNSDGTAKVNFDTEGDSYFNGGNVGIGTESPTHKLEVTVSDSGDPAVDIYNTHATNGYGLRVSAGDDDNVYALRVGDKDGADLMTVWGGGKATFTGEVGIGTVNPDSQFHLHGSTGIRLTDSNQNANEYAEIKYDNSGVTNLYINNDWTGSNALINFQLAGSTKMAVRGDGNVGIGTTSPAQALDVAGSIISTGVVLAPTYGTFIHSFTDDIGTSTHYLPWNSSAETQGNDYSSTSFVVPMNMVLVKLYVRIETISNSGSFNLTVAVVSKPNGSITNTTVGTAVKSVSVDGKNYVYSEADFDSSPQLTTGQMGSIKFQSSGDMGNSTDFFVTSVWRMDNNTI